MFYGEILANNENIDSLNQFLGKNGLPKNDDIFGENFFMGLEMLYKLPEGIRNHKRIQMILKKYEAKVGSWDVDEILKRFENIETFIKNTDRIDTKMSHQIISKLQKKISKPESTDKNDIYVASIYIIMIVRIGTPEAVEQILSYIRTELLIKKEGLYSTL